MDAATRSGGGDPVAQIFDSGQVGRDIRKRLKEACAKAGDPLTTQAIFAWRDLKAGIPPRRVDVVARVLGLRKSDIRPDLYDMNDKDDLATQLAVMQAELDTMRKRLARRGNRRVVASVIKLRKTSKRANRIERIRHVKRKRSTSKRVG